MHPNIDKKPYVAPALIIHGDVAIITQGGQNGDFTDAVFNSNTPRGQLTFS